MTTSAPPGRPISPRSSACRWWSTCTRPRPAGWRGWLNRRDRPACWSTCGSGRGSGAPTAWSSTRRKMGGGRAPVRDRPAGHQRHPQRGRPEQVGARPRPVRPGGGPGQVEQGENSDGTPGSGIPTSPRTPTPLHIGRLVHEKGVRDVIAAMPQIKESGTRGRVPRRRRGRGVAAELEAQVAAAVAQESPGGGRRAGARQDGRRADRLAAIADPGHRPSHVRAVRR